MKRPVCFQVSGGLEKETFPLNLHFSGELWQQRDPAIATFRTGKPRAGSRRYDAWDFVAQIQPLGLLCLLAVTPVLQTPLLLIWAWEEVALIFLNYDVKHHLNYANNGKQSQIWQERWMLHWSCRTMHVMNSISDALFHSYVHFDCLSSSLKVEINNFLDKIHR